MTDFDYQIECTTHDLVQKTAEDFSMTVPEALRVVYNSETYEKMVNPKTGLYFQSSLYVYDFLKNEIQTGKMS